MPLQRVEQYIAAQERCQAQQRTCLGFHAPETKQICANCLVKIIDRVVEAEWLRVQMYLEAEGLPELGAKLAKLGRQPL